MNYALLIGSYNGQDSLGDKGLLKAVSSQIAKRFNGDFGVVCHVANIEEGFNPGTAVLRRGIWQCTSACASKTHVFSRWPLLHLMMTYALIPVWLLSARKNRDIWRSFKADCKEAEFLYFYGGTQLSSQWFWLNMPSILITILMVRRFDHPVFFGPQQYGPLDDRQRGFLLRVISWFVEGVRTRSSLCQKALGLLPEQLTLDEIFSCADCIPVEDPADQSDYILVNFRGSNFLQDDFPDGALRFVEIVAGLSRKWMCGVKVVQMSGSSFCDDKGILGLIANAGVDVELIPHTHDERDVYLWARNAKACVAMSFHACVLTLMAGKPAIPVTSGRYYDYKYVDFDRYTGGQGVPVIDLETKLPAEWITEIDSFVAKFSGVQVIETRRVAGSLVDRWYDTVCGQEIL